MSEYQIPEGLDIEHWPEFLAFVERLMLTCTDKDRSVSVNITGLVKISHSYQGTEFIEGSEEIPDNSLYKKFQ